MEDFIISLLVQYPALTTPVLVFTCLGYIWTQLRPHIDPENLAKLPSWLTKSLEFVAGNRGKAENLLQARKDQIK